MISTCSCVNSGEFNKSVSFGVVTSARSDDEGELTASKRTHRSLPGLNSIRESVGSRDSLSESDDEDDDTSKKSKNRERSTTLEHATKVSDAPSTPATSARVQRTQSTAESILSAFSFGLIY